MIIPVQISDGITTVTVTDDGIEIKTDEKHQ